MGNKIAAITPNFNQAHLLVPHIKWLSKWVDKIIVVQGRAWKRPVAEHLSTPDNSREILQTLDVEVIEDRTDDFCADLYNQALERLQDYDIATRFDTDMFITEADSKKFFDFLRNSDADYFPLDFSKNSINYYLDFDHGLMDAEEFDPLAIRTTKRFSGLLDVDGKKEFVEGIMLHHLKHIGKNEEPTKAFLNSPKATEWVCKYTPHNKFLQLPQELKALFWKYSLLEPVDSSAITSPDILKH